MDQVRKFQPRISVCSIIVTIVKKIFLALDIVAVALSAGLRRFLLLRAKAIGNCPLMRKKLNMILEMDIVLSLIQILKDLSCFLLVKRS